MSNALTCSHALSSSNHETNAAWIGSGKTGVVVSCFAQSFIPKSQINSHQQQLGTVWNKWGGDHPFSFSRTIQMLQPRIDGWVTFRKKIGAANGEPANAY